MVALLTAIGLHLPNLAHLLEDLHLRRLSGWNIDWASSLPRGLRQLLLPFKDLHHDLLQHLLHMPQLEKVSVRMRSIDASDGDGHQLLHSDTCTWRKLQLGQLPSFRDMCRFTTWMARSLSGAFWHSPTPLSGCSVPPAQARPRQWPKPCLVQRQQTA